MFIVLISKLKPCIHSEVHSRIMITGRHMVRDVSCKKCQHKLGWMYEFAIEDAERYVIQSMLCCDLTLHNYSFLMVFAFICIMNGGSMA